MRLPRLLLGVAALWCTATNALYQDEAGEVDFQHALLGAPEADSTFFFQPTLSSRATLLYAISEKGVIGAVNPKNGSLVWRQKLTTGGSCGKQYYRGYLGGANGTNAVVSAYGDTVSAWEAASGRMLWSYGESGCIKSLAVPDLVGITQDPVVLIDEDGLTKLVALNGITGRMLWEVKDDVNDIPFAITSGFSHLFYVALRPAGSKGYKIHVTTVHPRTAKPVLQSLVNSEADIKTEDDILFISSRATDPFIAWTDKALKEVKINILATEKIQSFQISHSGMSAVTQVSIHISDNPEAQRYFLIQYTTANSHWGEIYAIDQGNKSIKKIHDLPELEGNGKFSASSIKGNVFFSRLTENKAILYFASSGAELETWQYTAPVKEQLTHAGGVAHLTTEVVTRGASSYAVRGAAILQSHDLVLIRNGELDWARMESLAGIKAAAWAETPVAEDLARQLTIEAHTNPLAAYIHRLTRHAKDLQYLPSWLEDLPRRISRSLTGAVSGADARLSGEAAFGFQKLVVVATENGRVIALDTGSHGQAVWTVQAVELPPRTKWNVTDVRITGDRVLVLAEDNVSVTLELSTGAIVEKKSTAGTHSAGRIIPISIANSQSTLLRLSADGVPQLDSEVPLAEDTVVVTQSADTGALAGWLMNDPKGAREVWSFAVPEEASIAAVATRPAHDPVASIGRALGDRNVLYKYLNRNTALVVMAHPSASSISVHLLDTINGQTLHRTRHEGVDTSKPITATMSENWFVYTYFADPSLSASTSSETESSKGYILSMSELFESPLPNDHGPLEESANFSSLAGRSYIPAVISQSYIISAPITYLTTTSTKQGITPRSLLAYSPALSGILAIPVSILSPRKPIGRDPTAAEREEGLVRYSPVLDFPAQWTITYSQEILGVNGIAVAPTLMESTSLVFAFGELDVFGTRVAPIGFFDILGKGFGKVQLLLTIVALAVGTRFLAPMVQKKQIDGLWSS